MTDLRDLWAQRTLRRFRWLLAGIGLLLALTEIVALTSSVDHLRPLSLGEITTNILFALGFVVPLLLYLCSLPRLRDLLKMALTGGLLALLLWPLRPAVTDSDWITPAGTVAAKLITGLGLSSLGALSLAAWYGAGARRTTALLYLLPACVTLGFTLLAGIFYDLISSVFPNTYDSFACAADAAFGLQPSFAVGRLFQVAPPFGALCYAVYLTPAMIFIYALEIRLRRPPPVDVMSLTLALMLVGYGLYFLYPVCGPRPAFRTAFPDNPPSVQELLAGRMHVGYAPRNGVPSLHIAAAYLVYWHARHCGRWARLGAAIFLVGTFLATMGVGEHYLVDLIIALPFTLAVCAACIPVEPSLRRLRWTAVLVGLVLVIGWYLFLFRPSMLLVSPLLPWGATLATVAAVVLLGRRLDPAPAAEPERPPQQPALVPEKVAPGPPGQPLLGNLIAFRRDVLGLLLEGRRRYGDVVRYRLGPRVIHIVSHPDHVRQVLVTNQHNYNKHTRSSTMIRGITGDSLLVASGDAWLRQRRLMQPLFQQHRLARFLPLMVAATEQMLERWRPAAAKGEPIDAASEMMRLTYTIVGRSLFGADVERDVEDVERAATVVMQHTYRRLERLFDWPLWLPTPGNRRFRRELQALNAIVYRIIRQRRLDTRAPADLLTLLLCQHDEDTGAGMSEEQVRNETITLLLAGHETTANALTWTWYLLSKYPEAARQVRAEVGAVLGNRPPTFEDLARLRYTTAVIHESMRLYPPIWIVERRALAGDTIGGYDIPAGSTVVYSPYVSHRHPEFWPNPEGFDPDRFNPEQSARRPPYAYIPFGGGQRLCIGNHFAMMEAQIILAMVARAHRLDLLPGFPVEPQPGITLRTRHGLLMRLFTESHAGHCG